MLQGQGRSAAAIGIIIPVAVLIGAALAVVLPADAPAIPIVLAVAVGGGLLGVGLVDWILPEPEAIGGASDGWAGFMVELERARRYERPMALMRIAQGHVPEDEGPAAAGEPLVDRVRVRTRQVDLVWQEGDQVYVVVPEGGSTAVADLVTRLRAVTHLAGIEVRSAVFPDQAVTAGALLAMVHDGEWEPVPLPLRAAREALATPALDVDLPRTAEDGRA